MLYKGSHSFICHQTWPIPAFIPHSQAQGITAFWSVLIAPTHGGMARLSWPGWLVRPRLISRTGSRTPIRSTFHVLTGPGLEQLRWTDRRRYKLRQTKPPPGIVKTNDCMLPYSWDICRRVIVWRCSCKHILNEVITELFLLHYEWVTIAGVQCRFTETGGYQCFCQWGMCDTRPMNGTTCEGTLGH